jgi:hypothetical protein
VLRQVAEGVLIHESEFMQSNAVVVQGTTGVLLVDAGILGHVCAVRRLPEHHGRPPHRVFQIRRCLECVEQGATQRHVSVGTGKRSATEGASTERFGQPAGPQELRNLPTVTMSAADGRASWRLVGPKGEEHEVQHLPVYTADDLLTLKFAVLQGTGMSILPDYMCREELRLGQLVPVLPGWAPPAAKVLAVFPSRRGMVPAVRRLLDFLGESVRGEHILEG